MWSLSSGSFMKICCRGFSVASAGSLAVFRTCLLNQDLLGLISAQNGSAGTQIPRTVVLGYLRSEV